MRRYIAILCIIYLLFLLDFKIKYSNDNFTYKVEYNGLLWVALDHYTIDKYNSTDIPIKWIKIIKI